MPRSLSEIRELVATMRELGITELDDIKLGPVPASGEALAHASPETTREAKAQRQAEILFAASRVRPSRGFLEGKP